LVKENSTGEAGGIDKIANYNTILLRTAKSDKWTGSVRELVSNLDPPDIIRHKITRTESDPILFSNGRLG
jgi:hypothetical protein